MNHSIVLLSESWALDNAEFAQILAPVHSPLTDFLMQGTLPRGFMNELISGTTSRPDQFERVIRKY